MSYIYIKPNELDGHKISYEYVTQKKRLQEILREYKTVKLSSIVKDVTSGLRIKKEYYAEVGYPVIAPGDIRNGTIYLNELKYVKKEVIKDKDIIASGDILVTAAGRSGQIIYVNDELAVCAITSDIIRIRVADEEKGKFIARFLKSELGQRMLNTLKTGLVNKILVEDIVEVLVPENYELDKTNYNDNVEIQKQATKLYKEAENIFYKFLDYQGEEEKEKCIFTFKNLDSNRLDPEYYTNFYTELYKIINKDTNNIKWQKLKDVVDVKVAAKPEISENEKVKYFSLGDVDEKLSIINETHEKEYGKLSNRMRNVVREGEIVTAKGGSATGTKSHATALITKEFDYMITTDAFFNLVPKNIDKYYLLFLLRQIVVINQINMISKGTIYKLVQRQDFEKIKIPRLIRDIEDLISKKIKCYIDMHQSDNEI